MTSSRNRITERTPQRSKSVSCLTNPRRRLGRGQSPGADRGRGMSNVEYFAERAHQELLAAIRAPDRRVRERHLELADAYTFRLIEEKRSSRMQLVMTPETASA